MKNILTIFRKVIYLNYENYFSDQKKIIYDYINFQNKPINTIAAMVIPIPINNRGVGFSLKRKAATMTLIIKPPPFLTRNRIVVGITDAGINKYE